MRVQITGKHLVLLLILVGAGALAQIVADQGAPGSQGPWYVTTASTSGVAVTPQKCTTLTPTITTVGTSSTAVPASALASRRYITVCNSLQNSGNPLLKCRADGTSPVMAAGNAGDVLGVGDCFTYPIASTKTLNCISDAAGTNVTGSECL